MTAWDSLVATAEKFKEGYPEAPAKESTILVDGVTYRVVNANVSDGGQKVDLELEMVGIDDLKIKVNVPVRLREKHNKKVNCECGNNEFVQDFAEHFGEFVDGQYWPTIHPTRIPVGPWKCSRCGLEEQQKATRKARR